MRLIWEISLALNTALSERLAQDIGFSADLQKNITQTKNSLTEQGQESITLSFMLYQMQL